MGTHFTEEKVPCDLTAQLTSAANARKNIALIWICSVKNLSGYKKDIKTVIIIIIMVILIILIIIKQQGNNDSDDNNKL